MTSLARQQAQAATLVAGHGRIAASFFGIGQSRMLAWARRPQAAVLVAALADPERGWDAIEIGKYERAFSGGQYASMAPLFEHYAVQLWMPEIGGRVDYHAEDHEETMLALGYQSKREITRTRIRVRTAMPAQTREQGRYLGGRPPTATGSLMPGRTRTRPTPPGDGGAHRLEPDPQNRAGRAVHIRAAAGRPLGGADHPGAERCRDPVPVGGGPEAQPAPHRCGVDAEHHRGLPRQPEVYGPAGVEPPAHRPRSGRPANTGLGHRQVQRWNLPAGWVISARPAHPALVSEADFIAAQDASAPRGRAGTATRRYLLAGLLRCGTCGRRLESCVRGGT